MVCAVRPSFRGNSRNALSGLQPPCVPSSSPPDLFYFLLNETYPGLPVRVHTEAPEFAPLQVPCDPPGGITVYVDTYRVTQGGWIRLALIGVAGAGGVTSVELKGSSQVAGQRR